MTACLVRFDSLVVTVVVDAGLSLLSKELSNSVVYNKKEEERILEITTMYVVGRCCCLQFEQQSGSCKQSLQFCTLKHVKAITSAYIGERQGGPAQAQARNFLNVKLVVNMRNNAQTHTMMQVL